MSEVLTVPTSFGDIAELSSGLADRVDNDRIILYGPTPYDEGDEVGFAVLLLDGTPAIEGVGRVTAAVDGGDARAPEIRYDIVFDNLQLDTRSEVVVERILIGRQSTAGEATGEVALPDEEELAAHDEEAEPSVEVEADVPDEAPDGTADAGTAVGAETAADVPDEAADVYVEEPIDVSDAAASEATATSPEGAPAEEAASWDEGAAEPASWDEPPDEDEGARWDEPPDEAEAASWDEGAAEGAADPDEEAPAAEVPQEEVRASEIPAPIESIYPSSPDDFGPPPPAAEPPAMPAPPLGFDVSHVSHPALTRPSTESEWEPTPIEREQPIPPSGLFAHAGALPLPAHPPRPDLDPAYRVQPAPSPMRPSTPPPSTDEVAEASWDDPPAEVEAPEAEAMEEAAPSEDAELEAAAEAHEGEVPEEREDATGEIDVEELEELQ